MKTIILAALGLVFTALFLLIGVLLCLFVISQIKILIKEIQREERKMNECANCEYFDLTQNKCYIDGRKGYDEGKLLISNCDKYELGHWGIPEEIQEEEEE